MHLGICGARQLSRVEVETYGPKEDRLILVHAGIGEDENGVVEGTTENEGTDSHTSMFGPAL